jgi:hypothetical protein
MSDVPVTFTPAMPVTVTVCPEMGLSLASVRRNRIVPGAPGATTVGSAVATMRAPSTWISAVRVSAPLFAVTVTTRLERSVPTRTVPVTVPLLSVFAPLTPTVALLSTLSVTGASASRLRLASSAVTVAVTVLLPLFCSVGPLNCKTRSLATTGATGAGVLPPG